MLMGQRPIISGPRYYPGCGAGKIGFCGREKIAKTASYQQSLSPDMDRDTVHGVRATVMEIAVATNPRRKKMDKITQAEAKSKAANLRILAASQRANAAAHRRQATHPVYPGQSEICLDKADQIDAYADRSEAQAALIEAAQ